MPQRTAATTPAEVDALVTGAGPAGRRRGSLTASIGFGALCVMVAVAFVRPGSRPPRPEGKPARWKLVLWFALFLAVPLLLGAPRVVGALAATAWVRSP
jgi:hypothetical protein